MAQNFVGSNNINLLLPNGQFGSRLQGGADSASERYIYTQLNSITRFIFPPEDDAVLHYLNDDGLVVEPMFYVPIIPMILVNGTKGIGTGFSTEILSYNPIDIIHYLQNKIKNEAFLGEFVPYYEGYTGKIEKISDGKFVVKGKYENVGPDKIRVTELPVGVWTDTFKELLETLTESVDKTGKKIVPVIKEYQDMSKDTTIDFIITFTKGKVAEYENIAEDYGCNHIEKLLKLYTTISTSNMHLFNAEEKLKKYTLVEDIIDEYYITRFELYEKRKEYVINVIERDLKILKNKAQYIKENIEDTIDLRRKTKDQVCLLLQGKNYDVIDNDKEYKYLTKMPMDSVSEENAEKLFTETNKKREEYERMKEITPQQMWLSELDILLHGYLKYKENRNKTTPDVQDKPSNKVIKIRIKK
jgi:DNA topoisomerase-2